MSELDGIYEHLNELRTRVLRVVIVVGIIAVFLMTFHLESISYNEVILYYPIPEPLDNIAAQLTNYFEINLVPEGVQLIQTAPGQAFFSQIYIAALVGLVAGTPVIIRETVNFLKPAL